ncbi:hypothetical protein BC830DRAFT_1100231 [Chytriomyces sp. MP71]|nr:hypothetical protein BC830DRAFT_1100231 [Chytriomyces sp. MP71]
MELPAYDIPPPDHDAQPIFGYEEATYHGAPPSSATGEPPVAPGELPPSYDFKGKTKA